MGKRVAQNLSIDEDVLNETKKLCKEAGIPFSRFVETMLRNGLQAQRTLLEQFRLFSKEIETLVIERPKPKPKGKPGRPRKVKKD